MRSTLLSTLLLLAGSPAAIAGHTPSSTQPSALETLNAPGPEAKTLAASAGTWDVVATVWLSPGAAPIVARRVAERRMIGNFLQEDMSAVPGAPAFRRMDYLHFNRIEGRWQYVSFDFNFPGGIMPGWSFDRGAPGKVIIRMEPVAMVGLGKAPETVGRMERAELTISQSDADHETKEMRAVSTDGVSEPWTLLRFEYTRRSR